MRKEKSASKRILREARAESNLFELCRAIAKSIKSKAESNLFELPSVSKVKTTKSD